jgi:hypothetical protein
MYYDNLFPCIDFMADFIFHYKGIPAKINIAEIFPQHEDTDNPIMTLPSGEKVDFLQWLWEYNENNEGFGAWVEAYRAYPVYSIDPITQEPTDVIIGWDLGEPVDVGYQLHNCNFVYVRLIIHLPQLNYLQGLSGHFMGRIGVKQWHDPCPPVGGSPVGGG